MRNRRKGKKKNSISKSRDDGKGWKIFDWVALILFLLLFLFGGISALVGPQGEKPVDSKIPVPEDAIVIELFNGAGDPGIVAMVSDSLRTHGIDVRSVTKNARSIYPYTLVLVRKENVKRINSLIKTFDIPRDRVIIQRNTDIYEATLVLGRDYNQILAKILKTAK